MRTKPNFMKRFKEILAEEERALKMKEHARRASELYAEGKLEEADRQLRKAEKLKSGRKAKKKA